MSPQHENPKKVKIPELDKFHEIEIQEVFTTMVNIQNFRIQSGIFFGTVNLGALGLAFSTQKAGIIFFASLIIIAFVIIDGRGRSVLYALYYRALQLQQKFAPNDSDTFLNIILLGFREQQIRKIAQIPNREARLRELRALPLRPPGLIGFWLPVVALLIEVGLGLTAWFVLKWSLF